MNFAALSCLALLGIYSTCVGASTTSNVRNLFGRHQSICLHGNVNTAHTACAELSKTFPNEIYLPNSLHYVNETTAIWDQASWLSPDCVFAPLTPANLAKAVKYLADNNVYFTVRSGGHMPVRGHNSIESGGVLVATTHFVEKTLVPTPNQFDTTYLRAGSSFRWQEVYEFLDSHGLITAGGRVSSVGSSLILGGGLSYFSGFLGWAANNVVNFEVVLANGSLVQVNQKSAPDLFWALKGGSSNYGIVTNYDLKVFPGTKMFGGTVAWASNYTQQYLDAQSAFITSGGGSDDPKAAIMPNFGYDPISKLNASGNVMVYADADPNPKALENFTAIPTTFSTLGVLNYSEITASTSGYAARDRRWSFYNIAVKSSPETMDLLYYHIRKNADIILPGVNCSVGAAVQPITKLHMQAAIDNGGDAIALDPARGNFVIALIYGNYFNAADDAKIKKWTDATLADIKADAKARGLDYPWLFLNDAGVSQDPIATYGYGKSLRRMQQISRKYDPHGVFQRQVPGFKLGFEAHSGC